MSRYGAASEVGEMPVDLGIEIIKKAYEKTNENKAWDLYLTKYPHMTEKNYMPFEDFYKVDRKPKKILSEQEILMDVKGIIDLYRH